MCSTKKQRLAHAILPCNAARTAVKGDTEPAGTLTISAVESLCTYRLSPVLAAYRSRYPDVQLILRTGICATMRREVLGGEVDLAFTLEEPGVDERITFERLLDEPMLILVQPGHPLTRKDAIYPHDLEGETVLLTEPGCRYRSMFETALASAGVQTMTMEFSSVEAIKQCTMAGLGVTLLPEIAVASEVERGMLSVVPWRGPDIPVITQMLWHRDKWMSPALKAFIEMSRELIGPFEESSFAVL
ncbi:LysR family transcriptional regulator substrate-binding protein [Alicyclobacillus fastidiosus]|uniref:LysR family transcriptional regulator substrate-binding protein n=1 Tax=Alicyclobacillus fastidiosus TaxID=392011 RepID=A0ABV5ACB7_9BACL|nr:LysR family transcriptional regulator substrate-binding protein [Alicyclobacillus fastidiosus]WEH11392.1 LysR family transcriptional regulator substrate-binding protein [Alicyclobacillus fastidiosus]